MTKSKSTTPRTTSQTDRMAELAALLKDRTPEEMATIRDAVSAMLPRAPLPAGASIAPEFVEMMAENADKRVLEWLEENAPAEVSDLAQSADTMRLYVDRARHGGLEDWALDPIHETVVTAINALSALGHSFVDDFGFGHQRAAADGKEGGK